MPKKRHQMIAPTEIARSVLLYLRTPSPDLKSACARYLASLHSTESRREAALQTPADERRANAQAAIAARWSNRPEGKLPHDQAEVMARLAGTGTVTVPATGVRRRAAIEALVAAGRIRVVETAGGKATITVETEKQDKS